ncbi:hemolysin family protein [Arenimonas sp.]|uniref:hemolysin family protein n=1 Tax=Arenimonas sp. TaxID=1872635 RepID=UPI002E31E867|nr:hemolysin family protein [Arenimonas sp.]HEX4854486.1 hemolysin family protein [Arenimonas sp.]
MTLALAIVLFLIICNGFFALSEMSVVASRKPKLRQMAQDSRRAEAALALAEHPERFLSTVQVGITSIGILTGMFGGDALGDGIAAGIEPLGLEQLVGGWLEPVLAWMSVDLDVNQAIGTAMAVILITYFSIILGELVPKRIALLAPEKFASGVALPMSWVSKIAMPFVWLLSLSTRSILRLLRLNQGSDNQVTEEEIRLLVAESHEQGVIDADERNMINRVLRLGDRSSAGLMTPRTRIVWLDAAASTEDNLATMRETPFARYPVYRGSDADVLGILEVKSLTGLLGAGATTTPDLFRELRPALFVSESTHALKLLEIFREEQQTMALVVDEYGDIQGMVSANDLLDAVLGRVQASESEDDEALVVTRADGSLLVDGRLSTEELREVLSVNALPGEEEHDYHTVAGMVIARFGRIPHAGELFDWEGWRFEVVDLDGARIDKLLISRLPDADDSPAI